MDSRFGRACRLWSRPTHGLRSHSIEWPAPPFRQFGLGWLKSGTPVRRKQRHWRWWKNLVGLLVYPHREIFPVRLFWKEKPQEACCDQLTSYAAVRNGHHNNFRFIISFWHVDSPSVVIRWGSAGSHRSPSTHAPRTSQITLVSLHLSTSGGTGNTREPVSGSRCNVNSNCKNRKNKWREIFREYILFLLQADLKGVQRIYKIHLWKRYRS